MSTEWEFDLYDKFEETYAFRNRFIVDAFPSNNFVCCLECVGAKTENKIIEKVKLYALTSNNLIQYDIEIVPPNDSQQSYQIIIKSEYLKIEDIESIAEECSFQLNRWKEKTIKSYCLNISMINGINNKKIEDEGRAEKRSALMSFASKLKGAAGILINEH